jgi:septal ring factor EnvC (AmiA/AmiB activator)
MIRLLPLLLAVFALLFRAGPGVAEDAPSAAELVATENQIEVSELRQKELDEKRDAALKEEEKLSARLVDVASQLRNEQQRLDEADDTIATLKKEKARLGLELAAMQDDLSDVLAGLQRLEQNPPPALAVRPHDVLAALRSAMLLGTMAPDLRRAAEDVHARLAALAETENSLAEEARRRQQALEALQESREEMTRLADEKRKLAKALVSDLEAERQRGEVLAKKAETLRDLLAALAAEEAKRAAEDSARQAAEQAEEKRRKELSTHPQIAFAEARGRLAYPVSGTIAKRFGEDTGLGHGLDGIVIATGAAADVASPSHGKIEFAGPFRSYGQMVIVNPGGDYLVLLAGLGEVHVMAGQSILAGEPVGRMGEKPHGLAVAKDLPLLGRPVLYVEFRKNGDPVDPTPWWSGPEPKATNQEAMR